MYKAILPTAFCAIAAFGQNTTAPNTTILMQKQIMEAGANPVSISFMMAGPMAAIPGAPYSAQAVTTRTQVLADGNRINQTITNNVARDSKGRTRREESLPGLHNDGEAPQIVMIEDPVASVHISLNAQNKTANKITTDQVKRKMTDEAAAQKVQTQIKIADPHISPGMPGEQLMIAKRAAEAASVKTDLGVQNIEGVQTKGTKITNTIPAGQIGNDLPIVITSETWFSPELKVLVMSKSSDPRMGETTYKLTNISRAEPDPALFQIPADYTITDHPAAMTYTTIHDK